MDKVILSGKSISGKLEAPPSKSFMLRAVALSVLSRGKTIIKNPSECNDALTTLEIAKDFGCKVSITKGEVSVDSNNLTVPKEINCNESGLAMRLFTPISALFGKEITLKAEGSLLQRPADFMVSAMSKLGVSVSTNNGYPPIVLKGMLKSGTIDIDLSLSSQFLSGLLIALPTLNGSSTIRCTNLKSTPYIDMTIEAIKDFGGKITKPYPDTFQINGNQAYNCLKYTVEGDWSGAASLLVAGAISGEITVTNLNINSTQADRAILSALKSTGCLVKEDENSGCVFVKKAKCLKSFQFDALHCPDLFPVLTALAANCNGVSKISGVHRLIHKESNRALVLKNEFNKIGVSIGFEQDKMLIKGAGIKGGEVFAHNDHRIAFALSLAALNANEPIKIIGADCVNKTYPNFFNDMNRVMHDII